MSKATTTKDEGGRSCFLCSAIVNPIDDDGAAITHRIKLDDKKANRECRRVVRLTLGTLPVFTICDPCLAKPNWRAQVVDKVHARATSNLQKAHDRRNR